MTKVAYRRSIWLGVCLQFPLPTWQRQTEKLGLPWAFEISKPTPSGTPPPVRLYFLILPEGLIKWLLISPTPSSFADYNTLLHRLVHPVCSSPRKVSQGSGISNILKVPLQSRLHSHSFLQWLFQDSMHGLPYHTPGLSLLLNSRGSFHKPLHLYLSW